MEKIIKAISEMTDQEVMDTFLEYLSDRVSIATHFVVDNDGIIRSQILQVQSGDKISMSEPEYLGVALIPATKEQIQEKLN